MNETANIQNLFLANLVTRQARAYLFLVNGIKLKGVIGGYDEKVVLLHGSDNGHSNNTQIVYKHAISAIVPLHRADLGSSSDLAPPKPRKDNGC